MNPDLSRRLVPIRSYAFWVEGWRYPEFGAFIKRTANASSVADLDPADQALLQKAEAASPATRAGSRQLHREWDEAKHPRDDDGKFAEKGNAAPGWWTPERKAEVDAAIALIRAKEASFGRDVSHLLPQAEAEITPNLVFYDEPGGEWSGDRARDVRDLKALADDGVLYMGEGARFTTKAIQEYDKRFVAYAAGHVAGAYGFFLQEHPTSGRRTLSNGYLGTTGITDGAGSVLWGRAVRYAASVGAEIEIHPLGEAKPFWARMGFSSPVANVAVLGVDEIAYMAAQLDAPAPSGRTFGNDTTYEWDPDAAPNRERFIEWISTRASRQRQSRAWDEAKHPRDDDGKFTEKADNPGLSLDEWDAAHNLDDPEYNEKRFGWGHARNTPEQQRLLNTLNMLHMVETGRTDWSESYSDEEIEAAKAFIADDRPNFWNSEAMTAWLRGRNPEFSYVDVGFTGPENEHGVDKALMQQTVWELGRLFTEWPDGAEKVGSLVVVPLETVHGENERGDSTAYADWHSVHGQIRLDAGWFSNYAVLEAALAKNVASDWHPTADVESIIRHEFGHATATAFGVKPRNWSWDQGDPGPAEFAHSTYWGSSSTPGWEASPAQMSSGMPKHSISGYANSTRTEWFAEYFEAMNAPQSNKVSRSTRLRSLWNDMMALYKAEGFEVPS